AVRELPHACGSQEQSAPRELVAALLDLDRALLQARGDGCGGELEPRDRGGLEHALLGRGQARDLQLEDLANALGRLARDDERVAGELEPPGLLAQQALLGQPVDDVN